MYHGHARTHFPVLISSTVSVDSAARDQCSKPEANCSKEKALGYIRLLHPGGYASHEDIRRSRQRRAARVRNALPSAAMRCSAVLRSALASEYITSSWSSPAKNVSSQGPATFRRRRSHKFAKRQPCRVLALCGLSMRGVQLQLLCPVGCAGAVARPHGLWLFSECF